MNKENKLLLLSSICMIIYIILDFIYLKNNNSLITSNNFLNIINIFTYIMGFIGIIYLSYLSLKKNNLEKYRGSIVFWSILFLLFNIISGILGFIALRNIKKEKRELPKIDIEYNYKWYIYLIVLLISLGIMFGLSNLFTNNIQLAISYIFILLLVTFIFRKDLKRDFKYFKDNFKTYNSYVFSMYGKSLIVLFILSISIKLYTGIENATNQETLNTLFKESPILISMLAMIYAPISEELLFRGIFRKFTNNKWLFIILSGFLFGIAHIIDDFQSIEELLYIFVYSSLGCFLAAVYYKTNNLFSNIYFHFIQNSISVIALILLTYSGLL